MNNIELETKVETALVEVSAVLIGVGTTGIAYAPQLPKEISAPLTIFFSASVTLGISILGIWHKFVNVVKANLPAQTTQTPQAQTPQA